MASRLVPFKNRFFVVRSVVRGNFAQALVRRVFFCYDQCMNPELKDGSACRVINGRHKGKSGIVGDINRSKAGHVTISVTQADGTRFKTLAKSVEVLA